MVSQDRWSLVTGTITLKWMIFCQGYVVFQDRWSQSSGLSRQVSLYCLLILMLFILLLLLLLKIYCCYFYNYTATSTTATAATTATMLIRKNCSSTNYPLTPTPHQHTHMVISDCVRLFFQWTCEMKCKAVGYCSIIWFYVCRLKRKCPLQCSLWNQWEKVGRFLDPTFTVGKRIGSVLTSLLQTT